MAETVQNAGTWGEPDAPDRASEIAHKRASDITMADDALREAQALIASEGEDASVDALRELVSKARGRLAKWRLEGE